MVLGEGIIQKFLTNLLSAYFDNIDRENLSVAVVSGDISLSQMHLKKSIIQHLGLSSSIQLVNGTVGSLKAKVPWHRFGAAPIEFELEDLFILLEAKDCGETVPDFINRGDSAEELKILLKQSVEEVMDTSGGWRGWLKSAGNLAKRFIDHLEIRINIRNVHIRYSADSFTAGAVLDSLAVSTTTQKGALKDLQVQKLAFYCNPLQDAVEELSTPSSGGGRQYLLEPVSGGVQVSFSPEDPLTTIIKGEFDTIKFAFSKEQLATSIWAELKRVVVDTAASSSSAPTTAAIPETTSTSRLKIYFRLGQAVVRSVFHSSHIDFVGEDLEVTGEVAARSDIKFRMSRLTAGSILSTKKSGSDFVQIDVKTCDETSSLDIVFRLGPVSFEFHPLVVGSVVSFLTSFSGENVPAATAVSSQQIRVEFFWESMDVNFYKTILQNPPCHFASGSMSASYICLELGERFVARGELGDFSLDHVVPQKNKKITLLGLAKTNVGYLFKFSVMKVSALETLLEFDLSAVRLVVVTSVFLRLWTYIFDAFLPAITGEIFIQDSVDDDEFQSVSGGSENDSEDPDVPEEPQSVQPTGYSLCVNFDALELVFPVSVDDTVEGRKDALRIELVRLGIKNHGAGKEIDVIDFDFEQVQGFCLNKPLLQTNIRIQTSIFREIPSLRVATTIAGSETMGIELDWQQLCRVCQVLHCNILSGASDGVVDIPSSAQLSRDTRESTNVDAVPWLTFELRVGAVALGIDNKGGSKISLDSLQMSILKFQQQKSSISIACDDLALSDIGTVGLINLQLDFISPTASSVQVNVNDPVCRLDLGRLIDLQRYFFYDTYESEYTPIPYTSLSSRQDINSGAEKDFILNINLINSRLVLPASAPDREFFVSTSIISFHQSSGGGRKVVVNNASIHFDFSPLCISDESKLIVANLDLFVSFNGGEFVKINVEPLSARIGFSHIKELQVALQMQRESIARFASSSFPIEEDQDVSTTASRSGKREIEMVWHSVSVLVVNDFAALQNTPLLHLSLHDSEAIMSVVTTLPSPGTRMAAVALVRRSSFSFSSDFSTEYFNPAAVSWEPLVEPTVKLHVRKTCVDFIDLSSGKVCETSQEVSFQVNNSEGVQVNVTESLIRSIIQNYRHWVSNSVVPADRGVSRGDSADQKITEKNVVVFSPYSVRNLTGEPSITVSWNSTHSVEIQNLQEVALPSLAVVVSSSRRIFVKIEASEWSLPKVPLDKPGVFVFEAAPRNNKLIAHVEVTENGRKVLTLQTCVLLENQFGCALRLKLNEDEDCDAEVIKIGESVPIPLNFVDSGKFRLAPLSSSAFSGSVSIVDIRARTESKLWQLKCGDEFMYLSGSKNVYSFQDKQATQLIISVFAPVRLLSTIPCMVDIQVGSASRSIGLNGQEFITSVPLTGKLEMKLSLFENSSKLVSVKDSIQVWPVPAKALEQDVSTKQFYLPIQFRQQQENFSGVCLELRLFYESVAVKPPLLTLHTPHWLACVDVPPQLRFVYEDNNESSWFTEEHLQQVVTSSFSEKIYVCPLDCRSKKIAARLNNTRSEPFVVDTIGATGQVTLDAFDEVGKVRVKQDFAVRVAAAPAGVVRDFPVKITTVSPKYIVVNSCESMIFVRQFGTPGNGMEIKSGEQVPFRWWREAGNERTVQVGINTVVWSEKFKVNEIGESPLRGVEGLRVEVRIFRGGFYIVFSPSSESSFVEKTVLLENSSVYRFVLPGLSVSLTGPVESRNSVRSEIFCMHLKNVVSSLSLSSVANEIDLRIGHVQLDDMRSEAKFPVVFTSTDGKKSSSARPAAVLEIFASWQPPSAVLNFESLIVRIADSELFIDYSIVSDLTDMMLKCTVPHSSTAPPFRFVPALEVLPVGSLRICSFRELILHPMRVSLSFSPGKTSSAQNFSVFHRAISSLAAVERCPLKFQALVLRKFRASRSNVASVITEHYKFELYREMRTIMGSAEMFGNPIGLIGSVSTGVSDLFSEPINAIREMQGPEDVINVADKTAKGAKSFFKNTAFGVFNSFSKLAATSAQTLSILTEDEEFLKERSDINNKSKPAHIGDGVAVGAVSFGRGLISGLSGLVTKPVEGLEQEGIAGFAKGTVKGVGGLFLKPVAGLLDFAKSTADGVVSSTRDASLDSNQIRLPRMLYRHDRLIRVIDPEHSLLKWYLSRLDSMPSDFTYCAHIFDSQNGLLVAASSEHLVAADTNAKRLTLLVPLWRLVGVTTDLDNLILSVTVLVRTEDPPSTSKIDLELSSVHIVKSVQQLIANAMEL